MQKASDILSALTGAIGILDLRELYSDVRTNKATFDQLIEAICNGAIMLKIENDRLRSEMADLRLNLTGREEDCTKTNITE